MMLPDAELDAIRADLAAIVCDTPCVIKHVTIGTGTYGEPTETEGMGIEAMAGLEAPGKSTLTQYATLIASKTTWVVHFPYGTDVQENSNIYIKNDKLKVQGLLDLRSFNGLTDVLAVEVF
jgi:hypothetical protein